MGFFTTIFLGFILLIVAWILYAIYYERKTIAHYKKIGIPYLEGGYGRAWNMISGASSLMDSTQEIYKLAAEKKAPIVAQPHEAGNPSFIITDLDLIKRILVKDFHHFPNLRKVETTKSNKYFSKMLPIMRDEQWKASRAKMTPAFTTSKIRRIFEILKTSSQRMDTYLKKQINYPTEKSMDADFSQLLLKYSMDVIANSTFGIDSKSWETKMDELSTFDKFGKQFQFNLDVKTILKFMVMFASPKLADLLGLEVFDDESQTYFAGIIKDVLKTRRQTGERREDFLQLMMDLQQGILKADEEVENQQELLSEAEKLVFDDEHLIANALMFFSAGFDTTQTALVFSCFSLATEQNVQEKLYEEVKSVMEKNEGKLTYEALAQMPYMDMVLNETMRMYPAAVVTERQCAIDYVVEESGFKIEKGSLVQIPLHGIHMDSKYYPDPTKFDPERFSAESKATRHPFAYLPFLYGPRSCIGMRFALVKIKAVIAQLVYSYKLAPCDKTQIPVKFDTSASAKPLGGMWLNISVRDE